jgi:geranylgeranyl diphosphate synthase, type II
MASGGNVMDAVNSAVAIELFHNAFLIKDDIEDDSEYRRKQETIKSRYGVPIAINVGDALAVIAINLLLENVDKIEQGIDEEIAESRQVKSPLILKTLSNFQIKFHYLELKVT